MASHAKAGFFLKAQGTPGPLSALVPQSKPWVALDPCASLHIHGCAENQPVNKILIGIVAVCAYASVWISSLSPGIYGGPLGISRLCARKRVWGRAWSTPPLRPAASRHPVPSRVMEGTGLLIAADPRTIPSFPIPLHSSQRVGQQQSWRPPTVQWRGCLPAGTPLFPWDMELTSWS